MLASPTTSPPLDGPPLPRSTRQPCTLRLYVYEGLLHNQSTTIALGEYYTPPESGHANCLLEPDCLYSDFHTANTRQYSSEIPLYRHLLSKCPRVHDPTLADAFVVPLFFGTMATMNWNRWKMFRNMTTAAVDTANLAGEMWKHMSFWSPDAHSVLPHLTPATAAKHVFFWTVDSDHVLGTVRFCPKPLQVPIRQAIFVHLGDDHFRSNNWLVRQGKTPFGYMPRDIIVPYRVSQWLPLGYPPPKRERIWLLNANVDLGRHPIRGHFVGGIIRDAARLNVTHLVNVGALGGGKPDAKLRSYRMTEGTAAAAEDALRSVFCLCPVGDSKGFTARFYFSLLHGCIPIRVDGHRRDYAFVPSHLRTNTSRHREVAAPFPSKIEWNAAVLDIKPNTADGLLLMLMSMPKEEVRARQRYLHKIGRLLLVDGPEALAPDAFLDELHALLANLDHQV